MMENIFEYPKETKNIQLTHWSYYENWDPYRNYLVAKTLWFTRS